MVGALCKGRARWLSRFELNATRGDRARRHQACALNTPAAPPGTASRGTTAQRIGFFLLASVVGALVGVATLVLIELILLVQQAAYDEASEQRFVSIAASQPGWRIVLALALGGLVVGVLVRNSPGSRYHGISDVIEACALNSARMPARSGVLAALAAAVSLGSGAPLGREGPAVHIGASICAWVAERLRLDRSQSLALLGSGAAAAVAVSFNAPIAAVIFAMEVIVGYSTLQVFAPVVLASLAAMVVRAHWLGSEASFHIPEYALSSVWELPLFAVLGVLGAACARVLILMTGAVQAFWRQMPMPLWLRPSLAGIVIGLVAVQWPLVLSVGYEGTLQALHGQLPGTMLAILLSAKLALVALAIASGFAGGVFGPAIFLGAMLGGLYWLGIEALVAWPILSGWPAALLPVTAEQGVYAVVGMAGVASALLGAPISTILIVFELTRDYGITLAVMAAAAFSSITMQLGEHRSFFRWQLSQRNVNITSGRDMSLLVTRRVQSLVSQNFVPVPPELSVRETEQRLAGERLRLAMVFDEQGVFLGSQHLQGLVTAVVEEGPDTSVGSALIGPEYSVRQSTNIVIALQVMAERELDFVPVIGDREGAPQLVGVVMRHELLTEHYNVMKRARQEETGVA